MNGKNLQFIEYLLTVGEGVPITVASVSRLMGIHRDTAQKYLSRAVAHGYLVSEQTMYRPHITQTLYWRKQNVESIS